MNFNFQDVDKDLSKDAPALMFNVWIEFAFFRRINKKQ